MMEQTVREIPLVSGSTGAKIAPARGGLVTSFSVNDREILFLDRATFDDFTQNVRGGIPLLFPNAGPLQGPLFPLPRHGFARNTVWNITEQNQNSITLQLKSSENTRTIYPFDFILELNVAVSGNQLTHNMTVTNMGNTPMPTAYGIHPYFKIPQAEKWLMVANIAGFHAGEIDWTAEFDKSFPNPGLIQVRMPGRNLTIENDSALFRFVRIWHLTGKDFICIEPWTRDNFALDDHTQSLWIEPQQSANFLVVIRAGITK
jgi:galactose mutarotase-like enzyme